MPIESATYVNGLNASNPAAGDATGQGDDHIRLIKSTLVNTFGQVSGPVTATHTELNHVDGVTSNIQTQLDAKQNAATAITTENIGAQSVSYAASAGSYGGTIPWTSVTGRPTAVSAFTNDSGYQTTSGSVNYANTAGTIPWTSVTGRPTAVSAFTNDSGYQTTSGSVNYANTAGSVSGASSNGYGTRTVSTGDPSGGSDGDVWYKVA